MKRFQDGETQRDTATDLGGSRVKMSSTRWSGRGAKRTGAGAAVADAPSSLFRGRPSPAFFLPRRFAIVAGRRKWVVIG